jgi:hypothetical protein
MLAPASPLTAKMRPTPVDVTYRGFQLVGPRRCDSAISSTDVADAIDIPSIGAATIHQHTCVFLADERFTFTGFFDITTARGATVTGTLVGASFGDKIRQALTILGGTKRFRHASGCLQLTLADITGSGSGIGSTNHLVGDINRRPPHPPIICALPPATQ